MFFSKYYDFGFRLLSGVTTALLAYQVWGIYLLFDAIAAAAYLVVAFSFREDKDIMGVCIVLFVVQALINLVFIFSGDHMIWRYLCYSFLFIVLYQLYSDTVAKVVIAATVICVASEAYWIYTDYDGPQIYFSFFKISIFILARFLLMYRPFGSKYYLNADTNPIRLDFKVHKVLGLSVLIEVIYISEYLIRHLTELSPMLLYNNYPLITQCIAVYYVWLIVNQANTLLRKKTLAA